MNQEKWSEQQFKDYELKLVIKMAEAKLPFTMQGGIRNYVMRGRPTGSFLEAVISNNLLRAAERADYVNQALLATYAKLLRDHAPAQCWGSEERMHAWKALGGLRGLMK
jgi:hypothetical protein